MAYINTQSEEPLEKAVGSAASDIVPSPSNRPLLFSTDHIGVSP